MKIFGYTPSKYDCFLLGWSCGAIFVVVAVAIITCAR